MNCKLSNVVLVSGALLIVAVLLSAAGDAGKNIYGQRCASCHGKDGKGNAAMAKVFKVDALALDLTDEATAEKSDEERKEVIVNGFNKMPGFDKKLSNEEIDAVNAFARTLGGETAKKLGPATETSKTPDTATDKPKAVKTVVKKTVAIVNLDEAEKKYSAKCASCHGKDARGNPAMTKVFKVDAAALDLSDAATLDKADAELSLITAEGVGKMPAFKDKLSKEEIDGLTAYLRSLAAQ